MGHSNQTARKTLYGLVALSAVAVAFSAYRLQQTAALPQAAHPEMTASAATPARATTLVSLRPAFDFGMISMAAGNVATTYLIKNSGDVPLNLNRIYTSCMCTRATLALPNGRKGPFGMPGHGGATDLSAQLAPGQTASLEVVFDPAAHGPAGLGRVERTVTVESREAAPLELRFVAMVKP
ncbi:MAG TPA: DUF1573 domain-containing protein [Burkholderiaceae bacterium]|nr:DUF1573 domain-containing protein [Burkholderiaceae bacterium]